MYNFNHLYYLYMTVKSGGVTAAAKRLNTSQPSLSGQLKVLEESLGFKLFHKIGRINKLTPEGTVVYGYCRQMFELSEEMHESISERIPFVSRRFNIGVSNEISNSFVVEVISHFLQKFGSPSRPKVQMISGTHDRLIEQLRFREIDAVFSQLSTTSNELENLRQLNVPVILACSANQKIQSKKMKANITSMVESIVKNEQPQWVMPAVSFKLRAEINQFFEIHALKGRVAFESDVIESLTRSVVDNVGLSFLPIIYLPIEIKNRSILCFGPKTGYWRYRISLTAHSQNKNDLLIASLSNSFKTVCAAIISQRNMT